MNRLQRRVSKKEGVRLQRLEWNKFEDCTNEAIEKHIILNPNSNFIVDKVFANNKYIVQVFYHKFRNFKFYTKVMCRRNDSEPICNWHDLFRIKNEIFGEEVEAIQFLPKKSELIDSANLYWFFIEEN